MKNEDVEKRHIDCIHVSSCLNWLEQGLTSACTSQSRLSRSVLAHGPRQPRLLVKHDVTDTMNFLVAS